VTSRVAPVAYSKAAAPSANRLVSGSRARVVLYEPGDWRLKVALQQRSSRAGAPEDEHVLAPLGAVPKTVREALIGLSKASSGLAEHVTVEPADWYVRVAGSDVILVPAAGWQPTSAPTDARGNVAPPPQFAIGSATDESLVGQLGSAISRIARARNLTRMSTVSGTGPQLELHIMRYPSETATNGRLIAGASDVSIKAGEFLEYRLKNTGTVPLDVTVLYLDACYGITPIFPRQDRDIDNQIKPNEERIIPGRVELTEDPLGWEATIAIGLESTMKRQHFKMLQQPCVKAAATRSANEMRRGDAQPLAKLFEDAVLGPAVGMRGPKLSMGQFVVKVASWRTDPAKK
jgi:hypothetical protein